MVTIGDLRAHGVGALDVWCGTHPLRCCHRGRLPLGRLPDRARLDAVARRLVCTACGAIGAQVMPDWPRRDRSHMADSRQTPPPLHSDRRAASLS